MNTVETSTLSSVTRPVETARGLPNEFYTDEDVYAAEKRLLFAAGWACVGFVCDVPRKGSAMPVDFMGEPLVMVRDSDDKVRVYYNVCRHRGMVLISEPTTLKGVVRCPYHSWCYGLDGKLVTTPHVGGPGRNTHPGVARDQLGLIEVRAHVWLGAVFINLSGDAPAFEDYASPLIERWADFADRPLHYAGKQGAIRLELAANWKLAVENYCESYHLPWVHPGLNSYSRLEDHYHIEHPGLFSGQGTSVYAPRLDDTGRTFANFPDLPAKWDKGAEYIAFYPNVLFGVHRDHTYAILIEPKGPGACVERVAIFYADDAMLGDDLADLREANRRQWEEIFIEDVGVVEGMQKGRSASRFDGGKFSPVMDGPTHCFHDWVARRFAG